jgi:hypothetical protein
MARQPCPRCGESRTGAFRFCRLCGFDYDGAEPTNVADPAAVDAFVPFDLFPRQPRGDDANGMPRSDPWAPGGVLTGVVVVAGILVVFAALLVFRPLG